MLEANAIGTTYLRAQTLAEPMRSQSLELLKQYGDARIALSESVPDSTTLRGRCEHVGRDPEPAVDARRRRA